MSIIQKNSICGTCGDAGDTRPYGKDGAQVCYPCAMLDEEVAKAQFAKMLPKGSSLLTREGPIPYIGPPLEGVEIFE